ncbi:rod shape-determining protein MreD [Pontivivens ytuae]|uniref:Rod shape-determining protein MreD n=1 Tax=Pontivivens ytuae TaxID=2789856 RepID=A0A7S9QEY5_9RHOB|nr:rod shape-determining protein MreD [Pontivivens ytuae]QPH55701.1 rod shape-determining protein MreD [Pontivivens ytuae]
MALLVRLGLLPLVGLICVLIVAVPASPVNPAWPMPDLLICLCAYWVLRRPAAAPMLVMFGLGLVADLMLMRPVGIGALSLVLVTEVLRGQRKVLRDMPFVLEWVVVSVLIALSVLAQALAVWISLGPIPGLTLLFWHVLITIAAYPVVALTCRVALNMGHRDRPGASYSGYLGG